MLGQVTGDAAATFEPERGRLFGLAYRLLGSASDAEDMLQDAFLRWAATDRASVAEPAAWLTTTVTNLCLTFLASARQRRESYVGTWLPRRGPRGAAAHPGPRRTGRFRGRGLVGPEGWLSDCSLASDERAGLRAAQAARAHEAPGRQGPHVPEVPRPGEQLEALRIWGIPPFDIKVVNLGGLSGTLLRASVPGAARVAVTRWGG
jgi:DNA-directed RNA polymerase specialized sigma24 family protein